MKIESFEETQAKFSIIPNSIFDILASADLNPYETKILVIIARNTYGWRADFDEISVSQFMGTDEHGKSTMSKPTVLKSLKSLEEKGLILSCLFVVNNVQKKLYFINTDESVKMVNLIKSGAIKYSELKSYRLHKIANQKSSFNLVNHIDGVNHVDGGSQSPLPGGSTTLTGVVNLIDGGSQSPLPTKNNLNNNIKNNLNNSLNNTPHTPQGGQVAQEKINASVQSSKNESEAIRQQDPEQTEKPATFSPLPKHDPEGFRQFWQQYPRRVARAQAIKSWDKLKPNEDIKAQIMHDIAKRKQTDQQWLKDNGAFIPHPTTYLNQGRWEDDIQPLSVTRSIDVGSVHGRSEFSKQPLSQHERNMIELKKYAEKRGVSI